MKKYLIIFSMFCIFLFDFPFYPTQGLIAEENDKKSIIEDMTLSYSSFDIDPNPNYPKSKDIKDFLNPIKTFYQPIDNLMFLNTKTNTTHWNNFLNYLLNFYFLREKPLANESSPLVLGNTPFGYKEARSFIYNLLMRHADKLVSSIYKDDDYQIPYYKRKNVYIFIGTSPIAPILALLEAIQSKYHVINNQSKFRYSLDGSIFVDIPYSIRLVDESEGIDQNTLFSHFYKYLDPSIIEGNNLIVVDFALSGMNVGSFIRNLKQYIINSKIKNYALFADIHTLQPSNIYNNFLSSLSTLPNINITYSPDYWNFLRKNLYLSEYDNPHSYYNYKLDDPNDSLLIRYEGKIYKVYNRYINSKMIYKFEPYDRYQTLNGVNLGERPLLVDSKYTDHWIEDIGTDKLSSIRSDYKNLKKIYATTIEKDSFFTSLSSCVWLFGNM